MILLTHCRALRAALAMLIVSCLAACSWLPADLSFGSGDQEPVATVATLADLNPAVMPDKSAAFPRVDLDTLVVTYQEILTVTDDPDIHRRVLHRLAGLEMLRGEENLYEQDRIGGQFNLAVASYLALLKNNPGHADNDKLLYQLSKAYDLDGRLDESMAVLTELVNDYPASQHYAEAQFRRAEIFFSNSDYLRAEQAYAQVIAQGESNHHYANALYMHGWSQFKREHYRSSLQSFSAVLDLNVPADNNLENLRRGQRELTLDAFRVMSVVFSYLDGPQTIAQTYNAFGERHYLPLLYENLAQLYLEKERYRDSAQAYRAYIKQYPQSDRSPVFYTGLINAYLQGGFAADVLTEKENYIRYYGIHSDYWMRKSEASRDYVRPSLQKYLPELARHYHAQAQGVTEQLKTPKAIKNKKGKPLGRDGLEKMRVLAVTDYLKAGDYYQEFIDSFPQDDQVPEMHFLLAESRFAAEVYDEAIEVYEIVAYKYPDHQRGVEAGYAAIVSYTRLLENLPPDPVVESTEALEHERWLRLKIASQLRFASSYQHDPRSAAVLTKSAEELLALEEYQHALDAATQLTRREAAAQPSLRKTAWLVIGHSEFEMQSYANAEQAYQQTLLLVKQNDPSRAAIVDRLAASVYKQAELALAAGNALAAADQFLRVAQVAPSSAIAVTAQYDAANTLMSSANYLRAIAVLGSFRLANPNSLLSADIAAKMVVAYQESGQWDKAADELTAIYENSEDEVLKRESLFQAAEFYEKAGDKDTAIARYRSYAHAYPQPFAVAMEARYKLSDLYRQTQQGYKRRFWLKKMIAADKAQGDQRTDRSRYLAAFSASILADDDFQHFSAIALKLPLKNSLKKKKRALSKVLASYKAVADYAVEEFTTLATYRIGAIYNQLSRDLMDSERPKNLDELALEQYDILLEEQAFPFEEKAIDIYATNTRRSWDGVYDEWVKESFMALAKLLPARYGKQEKAGQFVNAIY